MATIARTTPLAAMLIAVAPTIGAQTEPAGSNDQCWVANQDSGELAFSGVTEGRGFDGVFEAFDVVMCLDGTDLTTATIDVSVDTASADTDSRDRDQTLRSEEFFWVSQFPKATWASGPIEPQSGEFSHQAAGTLALRDVELNQPVSMSLIDGESGPRLVGAAEMMRLDYNVGVGEFEDTDFIANEVNVEFDLGLSPQP